MPIHDMIYLGNFADLDRNEWNVAAEKATKHFANESFGSADTPLFGQRVQVDMQDTNGDGLILTNNWGGGQEEISYSLPGGNPQSHEIDSAFTAINAEVTRLLPDGSTDRVTSNVRVIQDTEGNVFMMPPPLTDSTLSEVNAMTTHPILAIRFPDAEHFSTSYTAAYAGRYGMASFVPCFTNGTLILTECGERPVEDIRAGDLVVTQDHGLQPVRWSAQRKLSRDELIASPKLRPIRIGAGALGQDQPRQNLLVSPQHRVLVSSPIAHRMFGTDELLVAACHLTEIPGICIVEAPEPVTYVHLLFDRHEILTSNGALTESLYPGPQAIAALGEAAEELFTLFPQLRDMSDRIAPARPFATGKRGRQMIMRHVRNQRALHSQAGAIRH
ncbi:Hint domain-containing protein [Paracoccus sp. Z330]|uniref:Hint domain-containing protein n=1 Tax=Paracoccus onchidii TaxID=3017813 RepID=A0ABT4ZH06_9RHOB|nr:Hint domain-containing protein [Paracoccus onchidii]MDB6178646.1 Hint domain-containing protein [Paracoccus onchidii]